jgi:methyl halide transferase
MEQLDDTYWSERYQQHQTGWDLHKASPPLKSYIDQLVRKDIRILIPGCGNAYEADYLLKMGFVDITLVDISHVLVEQLQTHFKGSPIKVVHADFFEHKGTYDLILEQTFFCAIDPMLREDYAVKMKSLLAPCGKLAGVLFNTDFVGGPPFGGNRDEYHDLFSQYFSIKTLENCYNSILPRQNRELFLIIEQHNGNI